MDGNIELKTLKGLFTEALFKVAEELAGDDRIKLKFMLQGKVPAQVLEEDKPLQWFTCLKRQDIISEDDISYLLDLLKQAHLFKLVEDIRADYVIRQKLVQRLIKEIQFRSRGRFVVKMPDRYICSGQSPIILSNGLRKSLRLFNMSSNQQPDSNQQADGKVKKFNMVVKDSAILFVKHCNGLKYFKKDEMAFKLLSLVEKLYESVGDWLLQIYPKFPHIMNVPTEKQSKNLQLVGNGRRKRSTITTSDRGLTEYNRRSPTINFSGNTFFVLEKKSFLAILFGIVGTFTVFTCVVVSSFTPKCNS